ncbi:MAG: hypothetical protein SGJ15_06825 [Bacteroidota bacterium]|nr:hypothetical protein [Bacteroidota bacterium]
MKKYIFITVTAALAMMASCKDPQQNEAVVHQRDSLLAVIDDRDASVNEFINSFNEVEKNLSEVASKQHIILINSGKSSDLNANQKERIAEEITAINELMDDNSKKLKQLNSKLDRSNKKNGQLIKTIEILKGQLNQKYTELTELNEKLNALNAQVGQLIVITDILATENVAQQQTISETSAELHTAYYIVGNSKDLQKANLIDKKGGLMGMGKISKLSDDLDKSLFTKIDYNETTVIPINSKDVKIITTHPTDSYKIDKTGKTFTNLIINDPVKFWSSSKYLVITN